MYLACAWRAKEQHPPPRLQDPREQIRVLQRQHHCLFQQPLRIVQPHNIRELDIRILNTNISLQVRRQIPILRDIRVIRYPLGHPNIKKILLFLLLLTLNTPPSTTAFPCISKASSFPTSLPVFSFSFSSFFLKFAT